MSDFQGAPPDKGQEVSGTMESPPPPYSQATDDPTSAPPNTGYPVQPPPATGYPTQPPPPAGYPMQPPPAAGFPTQPPPPAGYAAQPQVADPRNVVIVSQPGVVVHHNLMFRDAPVACVCPNCHNQVTSDVRREIGGLTMLIMGALCIFGLWFFCCLIPLCIDACKDAVHTCPVCKHQLGRWNQL